MINRNAVTGEITSYIWRQTSEDGTLGRHGVFGKGADQEWFTGDDSSGNFSEHMLDENGLTTLSWNYDSLGTDGLRYTGDEHVNSLTTYQYDEKGRMTARDYFIGPGDDETWNTHEDRVRLSYTFYIKPGSASE